MLILAYHNIVADGVPPRLLWAQLAVPESEFARQIRYLVHRYAIVSLDRPAGTGKRQTAVLTFDDGYRSVLTSAAPLLAKFQITAYIFVNPAYVGGWNYRDRMLGLALYGSAQARDELAAAFAIRPHADRIRFFARLRNAMWRALRDRGEAVLAAINEIFDRYADDHVRAGLEPCRLLSWDELAELQGQGLRIGNHTLRHLELDALPRATVRAEIRTAQRLIRDRLRFEEPVISYPRGEVNDVVAEEAAGAGYLWGLTTRHGLLSGTTPTLRAPRIPVFPTDTVLHLRWKGSRLRLWAREQKLAEFIRRQNSRRWASALGS